MSGEKTMDQRRAQHVLGKVATTPLTKEHKSTVESLPSMIMASGLGPTLAFLRAKSDDPHTWTYKVLQEWLHQGCADQIGWKSKNDDLLGRLADEDSFIYRAATQEALAYAAWLKRAVRARVKEGGEARGKGGAP
ncbi:MAG TPA: type III-B CRISPR module-associated protein Cmr5 [Planctomycetota bacterium]|nr:type III-B CRISPR module-associated protein Cmr5 [Planctomycetota bacterium]